MDEQNEITKPIADTDLWGQPIAGYTYEEKRLIDEAMELYDQVLEAQCKQSSE
jgi:hypothetical protein